MKTSPSLGSSPNLSPNPSPNFGLFWLWHGFGFRSPLCVLKDLLTICYSHSPCIDIHLLLYPITRIGYLVKLSTR